MIKYLKKIWTDIIEEDRAALVSIEKAERVHRKKDRDYRRFYQLVDVKDIEGVHQMLKNGYKVEVFHSGEQFERMIKLYYLAAEHPHIGLNLRDSGFKEFFLHSMRDIQSYEFKVAVYTDSQRKYFLHHFMGNRELLEMIDDIKDYDMISKYSGLTAQMKDSLEHCVDLMRARSEKETLYRHTPQNLKPATHRHKL